MGSCTRQRDEYDVDEMMMPLAWITSRCDEYDVNEDDGQVASSKDDSKTVKLPAARTIANMMQ